MPEIPGSCSPAQIAEAKTLIRQAMSLYSNAPSSEHVINAQAMRKLADAIENAEAKDEDMVKAVDRSTRAGRVDGYKKGIVVGERRAYRKAMLAAASRIPPAEGQPTVPTPLHVVPPLAG